MQLTDGDEKCVLKLCVCKTLLANLVTYTATVQLDTVIMILITSIKCSKNILAALQLSTSSESQTYLVNGEDV